MVKEFKEWRLDQSWLLPPFTLDFVPQGHLAHFVRDTVRDSLDLSTILDRFVETRGQPPFHPAMMVAILLYACMQGTYSSRKIAEACENRVDFMAVTGMQRPRRRKDLLFRKHHADALSDLFKQVVRLCDRAGLVKLGHVALDGSKVHANASEHKGGNYKRLKEEEEKIAKQVEEWFRQADEVEDEEHRSDHRGAELPDWVKNRKRRLEKIRRAKAELEEEAKREAQEKATNASKVPRRRQTQDAAGRAERQLSAESRGS